MDEKKVNIFQITRRKGGKEKVYTDPDKLLSKAFEYFAWCENNPLHKKELMRSGDRKGEIVEIPVVRPFTISGMCVYCGISERTFLSYERDEELKDAALHILDIIKHNQLEGAITGAYNSSFVVRLLNLTDSPDNFESEDQAFVINVTDTQIKENLVSLKENLTSIQ